MTTTMKVSFLQRLFDVPVARCCPICQAPLSADEDEICSRCDSLLPRTDHLLHPYDNAMAQVYWGRVPSVARAAALIYHFTHSESSHPLYQLKYFRRPELGVALGRLMGQAMVKSGFTDGVDLIVPVPLAWQREEERGYNQSLMLAQGLSEATGIPVDNHVLVRTSFAGSQTRRTRWDRSENVKNAFVLRDGDSLANKHILLVDDVVTTGATSCACAHVLEQAHPAHISFACLAFVDDDR